ncbi:carbamoyl phosphate synthase large subunit [Desulfonema ishimotonii]|uniref:Carbamoyl phosphate synthase large subunit n=1 Tax=Desulfonema ishimotonii TaxID=45657 RepID=A0A401FTR6_9BACT|nr:carbamoyl-phosphate synthase large subunit [Desulfonema ishimotonii]GBC60359.1 carbamoyl phosphate synthase large subunit [Desulfonema ishimotonii]
MPKSDNVHKILIIGSGPVTIGQGSESDAACVQACTALRSQGYETVLVNANPVTLATDSGIADVTYIEPLNADVLTEIIAAERPDALLPNLGGQSGLTLSAELAQSGVLERYGVEMIGVTVDVIRQCQDRTVFKEIMAGIGIEMPRSRIVSSVEEAQAVGETLGCPVAVHPVYTMGGTGGGMAYNVEEIPEIANRGISASLRGQIMLEESLLGWQELELEVIRDARNRMITVCSIENVDPTGVHTGDSVCTIPMLTIAPELRDRLQSHAHAIAEAIGIIGCANIQFAHRPETGRVVVIEVNPRLSRTSALADRATGFPVAGVSALLACGIPLDELPHPWQVNAAPADYVTVKFPRWAFEKFEAVEDRLGIQMRSVGEVMGVGKTYKEALQKAVRASDTGCDGLGFAKDYHKKSSEELMHMLGTPTSGRQFILYEALRKGGDPAEIHRKTRISPWFIEQMKELVVLEEEILTHKNTLPPEGLLIQAKKAGFSDRYLARILNVSEKNIREKQNAIGLQKAWAPLNGIEPAAYYSTCNAPDKNPVSDRKKIIILGGGPNRIGQSAESDYCCVHAAAAVRDAGYEAIIVNCAPDAVSTGENISDKRYIEPLTPEDVLAIVEKEHPEGVIAQFGGQSAMEMARQLADAGVTLPGAPSATALQAENRQEFMGMMRDLGIPRPKSDTARTPEAALRVASEIGYPVMVRSSRGQTAAIPEDADALRKYLAAFPSALPLTIEKFLEKAIEVEAAAVADGTDVFVPAIVENIELAGVHSGDSACVIPPISISPKHIETLREYTRKIALKMSITGLINVRYAIADDTVYALEAKAGATRTLPVIAKVCDVPLTEIATGVILGRKLSEIAPAPRPVMHYGVKAPVFPFHIFPEVDPLLGPEMRSTGTVLGVSDSFGRAYFKSQETGPSALPPEGTVLITVADRDKPGVLEPARLFREMGFRILATRGTRDFLAENGIRADSIRKLGYGRPDIVDAVKTGQIRLVINTPAGRQSKEDDSYIRKASVRYNVPNITTTAAALAAARGIAARRTGKPRVRPVQGYHAAR